MPERADTLTQGDPLYVLTTYRSVKWKSAASVVVSEYTHTEIPEMKGQTLLDPQYVVGFVDGEGCFCVSFSYRPINIKVGWEIKPSFAVGQNYGRREVLTLCNTTLDADSYEEITETKL